MDNFPLIIFLVIGWIIYSNVKGASKGLAKAAQNSETAKEILAKAHARVRENTSPAQFGDSPERPKEWNDDALGGQWGQMTPTQRGRERARQRDSYPGAAQGSQQSLQQRLEAAKALSPVRKVKEFKQGSERKVKRQGVGRGKDFGLSSRHAPQKDQNRHRRDDWGQRGGGEIITTKSLLVLLALGTVVLYVLSEVSPSDLGF